MVDSIHLISSRRSYEFLPDDLRLTFLTQPDIAARLRDALLFQVLQITMPPATFGEVPVTFPPGLVLQYGTLKRGDRQVPLRFVHVEQRRIVIDLAGFPEDIDEVYDRLVHSIEGVTAADGTPVIGAAQRVRDYSELSCRMAIHPRKLTETLYPGALQDAQGRGETPATGVPYLGLRLIHPDQEFPGWVQGHADAYELSLRIGSPVADALWFSAAPLPYLKHVAHLERLEQVLLAISLP
ncbi:MAG: hypothetical protein M1118_11170 [Chloroflexi bacterium]|nr:hypothetical protein [Chloroflexota bacterium]